MTMDTINRIKREIARSELLNDMADGMTEPISTSALTAALDEIERLQARIDALMLAHCPDEMTPEQIAEWERHQKAVPNV